MSTEISEKELKTNDDDSRIACRYGNECYQKNPNHHAKFKHPPKEQQEDQEGREELGRKRTNSERKDDSSDEATEPRAKLQKNDEQISVDEPKESSPESVSNSGPSTTESSSPLKNAASKVDATQTLQNELQKDEEKVDQEAKEDSEDASLSPEERLIRRLFLTKMPVDFYKFYDFCRTCSPQNPASALKLVDLKLVGPYDVLSGRITEDCQDEPEKYLRHWRYYYDPPEFQTILKGENKEGLHYGYWRDDIDALPIFVAKNSANKNCSIHVVAPNIFAAVSRHITERMARATPFEKGPMMKLSRRLKEFAKGNGISLGAENSEMRMRSRSVVTTTFHGAGIVVPYDKRTQLGYRDLAASDSELKKILKRIDESNTDEKRNEAMAKLEEVVRYAVIAADELDFGTCLELGHDLFSSGVERVQRMGLQMLTSAYKLLNRQKFIKIAEAHAKERKRGIDLDVL